MTAGSERGDAERIRPQSLLAAHRARQTGRRAYFFHAYARWRGISAVIDRHYRKHYGRDRIHTGPVAFPSGIQPPPCRRLPFCKTSGFASRSPWKLAASPAVGARKNPLKRPRVWSNANPANRASATSVGLLVAGHVPSKMRLSDFGKFSSKPNVRLPEMPERAFTPAEELHRLP